MEASLLEGSVLDMVFLVIPADWVATTGFDRATLLGMRGWYTFTPAAVGTAAESTAFYSAIYMCDEGVPANSMDPSVATEYADFDVLYSDGVAVNATAIGPQSSHQLQVKVKRKLTSASQIRWSGFLATDTATPRVNANGVIRCLLQLDPPR